ncbi:VOC family protein [Cobetia amphilecti]|uniref:VOC family protein n=1 Tax=Cobetia amphilecti TaxID=1055104 RepID=UPI0026E26EB5|nr:VOC family protein [Cobetia amphilecti]MDO6814181.1 glyoxalase/bleomycin resistance/dioxygenase family protein [Cobetia amphilecti]
MKHNVARYGLILNTERFEECVVFYQGLFELPLMFRKEDGSFRLICLSYGAGYLMIEQGGKAIEGGKTPEQGSAKLRFNVRDIDQALADVKAWGIDAEIEETPWGRTIHLHDPDGNRVGIRDEAGFEWQVSS